MGPAICYWALHGIVMVSQLYFTVHDIRYYFTTCYVHVLFVVSTQLYKEVWMFHAYAMTADILLETNVQLSQVLYMLLATMGMDNASLRKLFWVQGNFCVHYQWEIILSTVVCCIVLIHYSGPTSISNAANSSPDTQPVSDCNKIVAVTLCGAFCRTQA